MAEEKHMTREEIKYRMKFINWHPLITVRHRGHTLIIRYLKDDKGELYGNRILGYDVIIDGVTGPDADTLDQLIEILRNEEDLKWIARVLEKNIRMRRMMR